MSEIKNPGKSIRAKLLNVAKQEEVFYQTTIKKGTVAPSIQSHRLFIVNINTASPHFVLSNP